MWSVPSAGENVTLVEPNAAGADIVQHKFLWRCLRIVH